MKRTSGDRVGPPTLPRSLLGVALLFGLIFLTVGCPSYAPGVGVTTGGQEDIAAARRAILNGEVPDPNSITVEGFLSEHAIEIEPPADAGLLFAAATAAWNLDFDAFTPLATLQIGFGTTLQRSEIQRPDLNLCLVIDTSGSMGQPIDGRTDTSKFDAVRIAIDRLLARLTANDLVSMVVFDSRTRRIVHGAAGNDVATIKQALAAVTTGGNTELAAGLRRGFETVRGLRNGVRSDRIMVFTDALLNQRSDRRVRSFLDTVRSYANQGIGATIFGVGSQFGHEVAYDLSRMRGGNYFFLGDYQRIVSIIDEEFRFFVTPIAHDVTITVNVPFAFDVTGVYGLPAEPPFPNALELTVPTLFLSAREGGGAVLVRIRPGALVDFSTDNLLASVDMTYETPQGAIESFPRLTAILPAGLDPAANPPYFETPATQRGVLLLNTALVLRGACEDAFTGRYRYYSLNRQRAIARLTEFLPYFDDLSDGLEDQPSEHSRALSQERELIAQLLANIQGNR